MRLINLSFVVWIYLSFAAMSQVLGAKKECDVNVCDDDDPGFLCETGSLIVIQEVMCRTRGRNCDMDAYQEVTKLCSGRQHCRSIDLWLVSRKYCERNIQKQFLSIVFVSYVCVREGAIESDCSHWGKRVSSDRKYLSSPGYPTLVTRNSVCTWRLNPPPGLHTDIFIREYLHLDNTGQQYLSIGELFTHRDILNLDRTAKRDLTTTIDGAVEISLHTDNSYDGHRMFIEYRYVNPPLEHLRPFPVLNRTQCGATVLNKTSFSDINPSVTSTRIPPNVNGTDVHTDTGPSTVVTVSIAVCAVGLCCCVVAIWITCRHRRKKKADAQKRNSYSSGAYEHADISSIKSSHPYSRPSPLVSSPRHHPRPADRVDFVRKSEMVHLKSGLHSSHEPSTDVSAVDKNGQPLDLSKYIISESDNPTNTIASKTSSRSSDGNIYEVVRDH